MDKDLRKIDKALRVQGFDTTVTKKGHLAVYLNGVRITTFSGTAGDHRSIQNGLAPLKRAGFRWPPKR